MSEVDVLIDRLAIQDVVHAYLERVDALDPHGAAGHFAADGWADYMTGSRVVGREAIASWLHRLLRRFEVTSHHVTNVVARVDGDRASASSYVYAYHRLAETGEPWHFWGRYHLELVRTDGRWLIQSLTLIGVDADPEWRVAPKEMFAGHPGRRSPSDT